MAIDTLHWCAFITFDKPIAATLFIWTKKFEEFACVIGFTTLPYVYSYSYGQL